VEVCSLELKLVVSERTPSLRKLVAGQSREHGYEFNSVLSRAVQDTPMRYHPREGCLDASLLLLVLQNWRMVTMEDAPQLGHVYAFEPRSFFRSFRILQVSLSKIRKLCFP
jgi:hypothetical protein